MNGPALEVRRLRALADCPDLEAHWTRLRAAAGNSDPFLSFDWLRIWLESFADRAAPWFLLAMRGERVVGIAPLVLRRAGARLNIRWLGFPVDASVGPLRYDFLLEPHAPGQVLTALFAEMARRRSEWDLLQLDGLPAASPTRMALTGASGARLFCALSERTLPGALVMETPTDPQGYWRSRSRHFKKRLGADQARLAARGPAELVHVCTGDAVRAALSDVHTLVCRHFGCERVAQLSAQNRRVVAFLDRVVDVFADDGRIDLRMLRSDGRPVSCLLSLIGGDCAYPYLTKYDPRWRDASPGRQIILRFITEAAAAGYRRIDFLSEWQYLRRFTGRLDAYHGVRAGNRRMISRLLAFYATRRQTWATLAHG